jgi:hypothetical protein
MDVILIFSFSFLCCLGTLMKREFRFSVSTLIVILVTALCFTAFPQSAFFSSVKASSSLPVDGMEYANGTIIPENSPLLIWYDWVDVYGTQVINYAIYTTPDYSYPVPIANLVGQHFLLTDGTQVFVASALSELEVYRDLNGDGVPQADFTSGDSEILYFMYTNMSDSYSMSPIQKVIQDSVPHYQWSFTYENAHAYLQNTTARVGIVASLIFSHITLSYDFSVNGNVSNLKTNFDLGKVTTLNILDSSQFSLDGLSLALLYATATYTSKPYATYVDAQQYNSTTTDDSAVNAEVAQVAVDDTKAYEFIFGGNYTLNRGESNETYQASIETYEAKAEAAALSSISITIRVNPVKGMDFFKDQLNLADLFGGSWQDFNMNYETSSLIYRICFPIWDGMQIQHDPVYVAYLLSSMQTTENPTEVAEDSTATTENPTADTFTIMLIIIPIVVVIAVSLIFVKARTRKRNSKKQE